MITREQTRLATEFWDFVPRLSAYFSVRKYLRGIAMKGKYINVSSVRSQLGLSSKAMRMLDKVTGTINTKHNSVRLRVNSSFGVAWALEPIPVCPCEGSPNIHGVSVVFENAGEFDHFNIGVPWSVVLKGCNSINHGVYLINLYSHKTGFRMDNLSFDDDRIANDYSSHRLFCYVGKTSVGLAKRFKQHLYAMKTGKRTTFYRAMRGTDKVQPMLPRSAYLIGVTPTEEKAYELEEKIIEKISSVNNVGLLNVVASRKVLSRLLKQYPEYENKHILPEYSEEYLMELSNKMVEQWDDPEFALRSICGNPNNLDYDEVMSIRLLSSLGDSPILISKKLDIKLRRVNNVVSGKRYTRII